MSGVFQFFTAILSKLSKFAEWFLSVFLQIFKDIWFMATDVVCWFFESSISIAITALNSISMPFDPSTYYSMIPSEAANILGYVGIPQAIAIIVAALVVRFILQTIPFVRWGS